MNVKLGSSHEHCELFFYRGRVALYAILRSLGVEDGDEVVVQAFTCVAVPEGIMATGARPVWVDIEANGYNIDPEDLRRKLTSCTRAIIVQHTYGIPANMEGILAVAEEAEIPVIEDCCHTLVSTYKGKQVGSFGVASFYSFEWGKPIVAGIGGSAVVNDPVLCERLHDAYTNYRVPGIIKAVRIQLQYYAFGLLYRPRLYWPVRALFRRLGAIGLAESNYNPVSSDNIAEDFSLRMIPSLQERLKRKLAGIDAYTQHCRRVADEYRKRIRSDAIIHPVYPDGVDVVFARYPLRVSNKVNLLKAARKANVELSDWYTTPVHPLQGDELKLVHYEPGSCPNAEKRCEEVVALPTHSAVSTRDVNRAVNFLNSVGEG
ncbi:DegT/DnrJ/EryC1/StrS aminotransferase family protein [Litorilinea aerophila]|uniref:DegT/DnrJ/EryC1/StrS aminotransferase family protein n=1 Tax=Litorilinea aerophila TaxID=1204385 RepID=A0A540V962_9CHLR|nr:DegT/DnrJ/EryC1/StrS aminotransferase family protein [Litorilinea aerophila]MCC9078804.1 DegT/DnrJ/EryC1/StrS aminotransferase family protein [Litorilinea aerophila]